MNENPWPDYPFISAFLLAAAATVLMLCGYFYFDSVPDSAARLQSLTLRSIGGSLLWLLGCGLASRTRNASWKKGFLCGLLFIPGLLLLLAITGRKSRQEVWQEANPELVGRQLRRQYRDVKALY